MKRILILVVALLIISCSKQERVDVDAEVVGYGYGIKKNGIVDKEYYYMTYATENGDTFREYCSAEYLQIYLITKDDIEEVTIDMPK